MRGFVQGLVFHLWKGRGRMRGIRTLRTVFTNLRTIALPPLRRPRVRPDEPRTEELVKWGVCLYVYSLIAHIQKILAGLVQLADTGNVAASAPVGRHVFEWTALSCCLTAKLKEQFKQKDWEQAWSLLTQVVTGSDWATKHGEKYAGAPPVKIPFELPKPVRIGEAVKEYEIFQARNTREPEARDSYSFLSDHSHPNAACLLRYHKYEEGGVVTLFIDSDQDPQQESFLPFVNCCLIDLLTFAYELLGVADESIVRPEVKLVLQELARLAPARLTGSVPAVAHSTKTGSEVQYGNGS